VHTLLGQWLEHRGGRHPSSLMFHYRARPILHTRVDRAVRLAADAAGLGHVTPTTMITTNDRRARERTGLSLLAVARQG